jgi:hypothetical protein
VALPALVLVLAVALAALDLGLDQVRCVDAARTGARLVARGEDLGLARARALAAAPEGARLGMEVGAGTVRVTVMAPVPTVLTPWASVAAPRAAAVAVIEGER